MKLFLGWLGFGTLLLGWGFVLKGLDLIPIPWLKFTSSGIVLILTAVVIINLSTSLMKDNS